MDSARHESERMADLLAPVLREAGTPMPVLAPPCYKLREAAHTFAQAWLNERGLRPQAYWVLGLGARRAKRQPTADQVLRMADHAWRAHGLATVFIWTPGKSTDPLYPGDDDVAEPVLAAAKPYLHPFRGPIEEALGLVWHACTSLFPDSGMMHFAAAAPGGVLGLFADIAHSPAPAQWGPLGARASVLVAERTVGELDNATLIAALDAQFVRGSG